MTIASGDLQLDSNGSRAKKERLRQDQIPGQHIIDSLMNRLLNYAAISMVLLFCKCTAISYLSKEEYYYDDTEIVIVTDESRKTLNRLIDKIIDNVGLKKKIRNFLEADPKCGLII